jgi:hypothetical protein
MKSIKFLTPVFGLAAVLLLAGAAAAQVSSSFDLGWHVLPAGGGLRQSTAFRLADTIGQLAGGISSSPNVQISAGFWYGAPLPPVIMMREMYLPLLHRSP